MHVPAHTALGIEALHAVTDRNPFRAAFPQPIPVQIQDLIVLTVEIDAGGGYVQQMERLRAVIFIADAPADHVIRGQNGVLKKDVKLRERVAQLDFERFGVRVRFLAVHGGQPRQSGLSG